MSNKKIKGFDVFLEEISISGNPGIPGEGKQEPGERKYLDDISADARQKYSLRGNEFPMGMMAIGNEMMRFVSQSNRIIANYKPQLEELATKLILSYYEDILDGVELDIQFSSPQDVKQFMGDDEEDDSPIPTFRNIEDEDLRNKIHKAKIMNNIIQGEAKNTKHILHTPECKEGIYEIFGEEDGEEIFRIWDEITKRAEKMDWIIPINIKADMMEKAPEGMAGACKVEWVKDEEDDNDEEETTTYDPENDKEEEDYTPVVRARGVDFPMLLHEAVKGIYELISSVTQPAAWSSEKEIEDANTVKANVTSFEDEAEDFRNGMYIAADLRDFINVNNKVDKYPNVRERVYGKMIDPSYLNDAEFLKLFRGILNGTDTARTHIDKIIDEVISELNQYELSQHIDSNADDKYDNEEDNDVINNTEEIEDITNGDETIDYSKLSKKDLQSEIDDALDKGDYNKVRELSKFLESESKKIYDLELERLNERVNPHNKK